jgi:hypothetical protein
MGKSVVTEVPITDLLIICWDMSQRYDYFQLVVGFSSWIDNDYGNVRGASSGGVLKGKK